MIKLPKYIFIDDTTISRTYTNNVLRSEMSVGPNKTRPVQSKPMFSYSFGVAIHKDNFSDFNSWFHSNLLSGSVWFLMNDPFDGTERRFRFVDTEFAWAKSGNLLRSAFTVEAYDAA